MALIKPARRYRGLVRGEERGELIANSVLMAVGAIPFSANIVHRIVKSKIIVSVGPFLDSAAYSTPKFGEIWIGRPQYHSKLCSGYYLGLH